MVHIISKYKIVDKFPDEKTENYIKELKDKNLPYKVCEPYIDARTKISHLCLIHNKVWKACPVNIKRNHGCSLCRIDKNKKRCTKTNEEYLKQLKDKNKQMIPLEKYVNSNTKIKHRCIVCGFEGMFTPTKILNDAKSCPVCFKYSKSINGEVYKIKLKNKFENIVILSNYEGMRKPMTYKCLTCNNEFTNKTAAQILNSVYGCCYCATRINAKKAIKSHEQFVLECSKTNPNISILCDYKGADKRIEVKCKVCGKEWDAYAENVLRGDRCPRCSKNERKDTKRFIEEMKIVNKNIRIMGEYKNSKTKIKCKCLICFHEWSSCPTNLLKKEGCPICRESKGEKEIRIILEKYNINFIPQKKFNGLIGTKNGLLSYDFYLPKFNKLIEFQGEQHKKIVEFFDAEEGLKKQKEHDRRKREYAKNNNIELIEIWYYDMNNIENILKEKLNLESVTTAGCI